MKRLISSLFFIFSVHLLEASYVEYRALKNADYIICLDGGARKTDIQVLNRKGSALMLKKGGKTSTTLFGAASNLNNIDEKAFEETLDQLFEDVLIEPDHETLEMIRKKSIVVAGFAGLSSKINQDKAVNIFEKKGFTRHQLLLFADAQIALDLVQNRGAVLIGGTGSICMGTYQSKEFRAGGFGRFIGDKGSAYSIGIAAINAVLEEECGYGPPTRLTAVVKKHFGITDFQNLLTQINAGLFTPGQIGEVTLSVMSLAKQGDEISKKIMAQAIEQQAQMIIQVLSRIPGNEPTPVYLMGGLFETDYPFKTEIEACEPFQQFKKLYPGKIELQSVSHKNIATEVVQRCLRREDISMSFLKTLPKDCISYDEFKSKFSLGHTSTEKLHPITKRLSQTMNHDIKSGLELLLKVDKEVAKGFKHNIHAILEQLTPALTKSLKEGGRVLLVGSGTSGRIAVDLAAKASAFHPLYGKRVIGIIAGGDSAIIRHKEGLVDSPSEGQKTLQSFHPTARDTVVLISGSGSASFNVGAGHSAADSGASVFYFYNSNQIPERTQELFNRKQNPVTPLLVDTGPQAIAGSTRLQSASISECCLGCALNVSLSRLLHEQGATPLISRFLTTNMEQTFLRIHQEMDNIQKAIQAHVETFSDPRANFRKVTDVINRGYVTLLSDRNSIREAFIDTSEISPTFSTNPARKKSEPQRKREEFRAFLFDEKNEEEAWGTLLGGRKPRLEDSELDEFLICAQSSGANSYSQRPSGPGNLAIGTFKLNHEDTLSVSILRALKEARQKGTKTGAIVVSKSKLRPSDIVDLEKVCDFIITLDDLPSDDFGLTHTLALKTTLNLISTSSMVLMHKVYGNQMIDVKPSNYKLVDRCLRLCQRIWSESFPNKPIDNRSLYHYIQHVKEYKAKKQTQGAYTPSVVNIVLNMLYYSKTPNDCDEIVEKILANQERLDFLNLDPDKSLSCDEDEGDISI